MCNNLVQLKYFIVTDAKSNWARSRLFLDDLVGVMKKHLMPGTIHTNTGESRFVDLEFNDEGGTSREKDNNKRLPEGPKEKTQIQEVIP